MNSYVNDGNKYNMCVSFSYHKLMTTIDEDRINVIGISVCMR